MFQHKSYISLIAAAAAFMAGCSSEAVDEPAISGTPMTFSAKSVDNSSRALTTAESFVSEGSKFAVWGNYHSSSSATSTPLEVFNNTIVTYTGDSWKYEPVQYWFPSQTYSFVAIHPTEAATTAEWVSSSASIILSNHNVKDSKLDLLAATHSRKTGNGENQPAVPLSFRHLLSIVQFTGTVDSSVGSETVNIKSIKIHGIPSTGSCTVSAGNDDASWTINSQSTTTTTAPLAEVKNINKSAGETFQAFTDENILMIIPQKIPAGATFEITYSYSSNPGNPRTYSTSLANISMALTNGWEAGCTYNYRFSIGAADHIIFNGPSVAEWEDYEGGNYIIQ